MFKKKIMNLYFRIKEFLLKINNIAPHIKSNKTFDNFFIFISVIILILLLNKEFLWNMIKQSVPNWELFYFWTIYSFIVVLIYNLYLILYSIKIISPSQSKTLKRNLFHPIHCIKINPQFFFIYLERWAEKSFFIVKT